MKRILIAVFTLAMVAAIPRASSAGPVALYSSLPPSGTPNVPSLGYQATSTNQAGQAITLVMGGTYDLTVTVGLSSWALFSQNPTYGTAAGWLQPMTFSLYNDPGTGGTPGPAFASSTVNQLVQYRPAADPTCPGGTAWRASDGNCYNGLYQTVQFQFAGVTLPQNLIYGLSFNTQSYGSNPTGQNGPYNSLNFALSTAAPSVGADTVPGTIYWDTSCGCFLTNPGNANLYARDSNWSPFTPAVQFEGTPVPEPGSLVLLGGGLALIAGRLRRNRPTVKS